MAERFFDRFKNLAVAGFDYTYFTIDKRSKPFTVNTHVYSGMLIKNSLNFRWRLVYNEDVDLCLQVLNNGLCTILLKTYLIAKTSTTAKMKGGNQTELYQNNNPVKKFIKTKTLQEVWPKYVEIVNRYGRVHHQVSWKKHFKHKLIS